MRNVPDIAIAAVDLCRPLSNRYVVSFGVLDGILARNDVPLAPGCNHIQVRSNCLIGQLKPDLIVPLSRAPMAQSVASGLQSNFGLAFCQQWTCDGGSEKIFVFVDSSGAHQFPEVVGNELLAHVFDVNFGRTSFEGFFLQALQFFPALADITADGHDFASVMLLQPGNDDGRV